MGMGIVIEILIKKMPVTVFYAFLCVNEELFLTPPELGRQRDEYEPSCALDMNRSTN